MRTSSPLRIYRPREPGVQGQRGRDCRGLCGHRRGLEAAMNDYTAREKKNYGDTDVSKAAYPTPDASHYRDMETRTHKGSGGKSGRGALALCLCRRPVLY